MNSTFAVTLVNSCALLCSCVRLVNHSIIVVCTVNGVVYCTSLIELTTYCLAVSCCGVLVLISLRKFHHEEKYD